MNVLQLRPAAVYALPDMALISGTGLVYSPSLDQAFNPAPFDPVRDVLPEEMAGRLRRLQRGDDIGFRILDTVRTLGHLKQDAVPLNLMYAPNYFHFLIEALPTFVALLERGAVTDDSIVVTGLLHPNMSLALGHILSDAPLPVLQLRPMQMVTCDRVVTAQPTWHASHLLKGGISDSLFNGRNLQLLRQRFEPLWADAPPPDRKLYVRRISDLRAVSNAEEVEQLARDAGYQVVQPEFLNFFEQVELFSRASHIMGPTGAWAANLLFAPQNARIDIFCPEPSRTDRNIWVGLGEPLGMQVDITYCPVTKSHYFPVHSDYSIPLETLKALLRQPAR